MGLLQRAIETYDNMSYLAGVEVEGKETLAPIGHIITRASIIITIDSGGRFISAESSEKKIPIPVTESSSGRSSSPESHSLCDQICYVFSDIPEKHDKYVAALKSWAESDYSHEKVRAVLKYVESGTVKKDLESCSLLKYDDKGKIKNDKDLIAWIVIGCRSESGPVWNDTSLQKLYAEYYIDSVSERSKALCMVSGEDEIPAVMHIKGIVPINGNAKIISANDSVNFTYRGRFIDSLEASSVGYTSSQKSHNALKWLVANQGKSYGGRTFICWNPKGKEIVFPSLPFLQIDYDSRPMPSEYKKQLNDLLLSRRSELDGENIIMAAFDAATTGRLSVAYYNEFDALDFLERLKNWDEICSFYDSRTGTYSPSLPQIINMADGIPRASNGRETIDTDDKIFCKNIQRLIYCRIEGKQFPEDIFRLLVQKAGNLILYTDNRNRLLFTACSVIRKYRYDRYKEEWEMALEPDKKDRSYQYGRLLAVLDKIERDVLRNSDKDRDTNALRLQTVYTKRPAYASKIIMERLKNSCYPRMSQGMKVYYEKLIGEIMENISEFPETEYNKPLSETYLLGYYLQRNSFYKKSDSDENTEVNDNE